MTSDRSQQKSDLPGTEPVSNGHAMPEVAAPDLSWLPSDHYDVVDIAEKEPPTKTRPKLFNALDESPPENDADPIGDAPETHFPTRDNALSDATDIPDRDWPGEESFDNVADNGFGTFDLDESPSEEVEYDFDIGEFDEDAQQTLGEPQEDDQVLRRAGKRAAAVAILLDIRNTRERDNAVSYLTELFAQMTHSATFQAIERAAEGIDFDTLKSMVEVRRVWMQRTDWWLGRYGTMSEISPLSRGDLCFTWVTARLVCLARKDYSPETMIDDEWLDEWFRLPNGTPGYLSFPAYIAEKVRYRDCELLNRGLQSKQQERGNGHVEIVDDFDWHRRGL